MFSVSVGKQRDCKPRCGEMDRENAIVVSLCLYSTVTSPLLQFQSHMQQWLEVYILQALGMTNRL